MTVEFPGYAEMDCPPPLDRPPRILICAVQVPFVSGGAESHIESLRREFAARDYLVDVIRLPFKWYPPRQIINDVLAWRLLDLTHSYGMPVDLAVVTRFPSYCIRHPRKVAWVLHQHRQAYDFLNTDLSDFNDSPDDDEVRKCLYELDSRSLRECRRIYANSQNVAGRMKRFLDIESTPLYHPPPLTGRYRTEEYGDYIFTAGRLERNKRVDLLLQTLAATDRPVRAVIAGRGPMEPDLREMAAELGVSDRVSFAGFISDEELLSHYARCGAVWYGPLDEDYGYVTLEAFLSAKPVITVCDSGGVLEFVEDGVTGYVGQPGAEAMAAQLNRWHESPSRGRDMGEAGRERVCRLSWDHVIDALTGVLRDDIARVHRRNGGSQ
ncbi:MAG TPA: glycosyltransferase [bacterium]|nr:glycosyltransferase [bacterium]